MDLRLSALPGVLALALLHCAGEDPGASGTSETTGIDLPPPPPDVGEEPLPVEFGGDRPVRLRFPASFDESRTYPLVLVLHEFGADAEHEVGALQLGDLVDSRGFLLLAPEGSPATDGRQAWNACPACCGHLDVDDVAYLGGLLDDVMDAWPVDPARVFIVGHSNGHFMAYRLACERADVVTAVAGVGGAATSVDGAGCDPARPVSVLHLHGSEDTVIRYEGGFYDDLYPGAVDSVAQWAAQDSCAGPFAPGPPRDLVDALPGDETSSLVAQGCPAGIAVELWTIVGAYHHPNFRAGFGEVLFDWLDMHPRGP